MNLADSLTLIIISSIVNGAVVWGVIKTELRFLRRDVNLAHRRLDAIGAPSAWPSE